MSRQYAVKLFFRGEAFISEKRFDTFEEAERHANETLGGRLKWEVETIRSSTPFEKV